MSISRMSRGSAWRPSCFIRDTNGQALAYAYFVDEPGRRAAAHLPPCLIGIETGMATHYVARKLITLGHDVRQVPPAYAKAFSTRSQERLP
jgi:transposase